MLKTYIKDLLIGEGATALLYMLASFISPQIFEINFFRMLITMIFIVSTSSFIFYGIKLVSNNAIINGILQGSVMILSAVFLPMAFNVLEFSLTRTIWTSISIAALYMVALLVAYKIQNHNLQKINEKLKENKEQ